MSLVVHHIGHTKYSIAVIFLIFNLSTLGSRLKYKYSTGGSILSSPSVSKYNVGSVFIGSYDTYIYAIYSSGSLAWKYKTNGPICASPTEGVDGSIYLGSGDQHIYALSPSGVLRWRYPTDGPIKSSVTIGSDGTIYVGSGDKFLYAVANTDGTGLWAYPTGDSIGYSSPAIATDGTIYIGSTDGYLHAVTRVGQMKWKFGTGGFVHSSPVIGSDGNVYFGSYDCNIYAISPTGKLVWKFSTGWHVHSSPVVGFDGTVIIGSWDAYLYAITSTGTLKWKYKTGSAVDSTAVISSDSTILIGSWDFKLYAIKHDGTLLWTETTGGGLFSSPRIGQDGTAYVGSDDRVLYAFVSGLYPTLTSTQPTLAPLTPTKTPAFPTVNPTRDPSYSPSGSPITPSYSPSTVPSPSPTTIPSLSPSLRPVTNPSLSPTANASLSPTVNASLSPVIYLSTTLPSFTPFATSNQPSTSTPPFYSTLSKYPALQPTRVPSQLKIGPSSELTRHPTNIPSIPPSVSPTESPLRSPFVIHTRRPVSSPVMSLVPSSANSSVAPTLDTVLHCPVFSLTNISNTGQNVSTCGFTLCGAGNITIQTCPCTGSTQLELHEVLPNGTFKFTQGNGNSSHCGLCSSLTQSNGPSTADCVQYELRVSCLGHCSGAATVTVTSASGYLASTAPTPGPPSLEPAAVTSLSPTNIVDDDDDDLNVTARNRSCAPGTQFISQTRVCEACQEGTYNAGGRRCKGCRYPTWTLGSGAATCPAIWANVGTSGASAFLVPVSVLVLVSLVCGSVCGQDSRKAHTALLVHLLLPLADSFTNIFYIMSVTFTSTSLFICTVMLYSVYILHLWLRLFLADAAPALFHCPRRLFWLCVAKYQHSERGEIWSYAPHYFLDAFPESETVALELAPGYEDRRLCVLASVDYPDVFSVLANILLWAFYTLAQILYIVTMPLYMAFQTAFVVFWFFVGCLLLWTKVDASVAVWNTWFYLWTWTGKHASDINEIHVDTEQLHRSFMVHFVVETIPQIIIQSYNNTQLRQPTWTGFQVVSMLLSLWMVALCLYRYVYKQFFTRGANLTAVRELPLVVNLCGWKLFPLYPGRKWAAPTQGVDEDVFNAMHD